MVKKTLSTIFLFMHIFYTYKVAIILKIGIFYKKITGIFVIEGKKQVSTARTMSALS